MAETSGSSSDGSFVSSPDTVNTSDNSNITSVTESSDLYVHGKLYENISELKTVFADISKTMQASIALKGNLPSSQCDNAVVLLTQDQIQKSMKKLNKDPVMELFTRLYNAARPLCLPVYKPDSRPKMSDQATELSSVVEKVDKHFKSTEDKFTSIQMQLDTLMKSLDDYRSPRPSADCYPDEDTAEPLKRTSVEHSLLPIDSGKSCEDFVNKDAQEELLQLLNQEHFAVESGRGVAQYGVKYNYMGANAEVKPIPPQLLEIMNTINESTAGTYELNSILVNKYEGANSYLPEHSDDEYAIDPDSDIFTISIGAPRTVIFKDTVHGTETKHEALPGSLYCMSKKSQGAYRHRIDKDRNFSGIRYSITLRCIHYKHLNSTCVLGDSNTEQLKFGEERGTFGKATPGKRLKALFIEDVNAIATACPTKM